MSTPINNSPQANYLTLNNEHEANVNKDNLVKGVEAKTCLSTDRGQQQDQDKKLGEYDIKTEASNPNKSKVNRKSEINKLLKLLPNTELKLILIDHFEAKANNNKEIKYSTDKRRFIISEVKFILNDAKLMLAEEENPTNNKNTNYKQRLEKLVACLQIIYKEKTLGLNFDTLFP